MDKAVELTYSYEMPNGLFRKTVRYYNENLIRELLVNSLAHSSRTISNSITIKVYPVISASPILVVSLWV